MLFHLVKYVAFTDKAKSDMHCRLISSFKSDADYEFFMKNLKDVELECGEHFATHHIELSTAPCFFLQNVLMYILFSDDSPRPMTYVIDL